MTQAHEPGTWTTVSVTAADHDSAIRRAIREARKGGRRVRGIGTATRQSSGPGRTHRWSVDLRLEPRTASESSLAAPAATPIRATE